MVVLFLVLQFVYGNLDSGHLGIKERAASALQVSDLPLFQQGDFGVLQKQWCKTCVLVNLFVFRNRIHSLLEKSSKLYL